jgi:hypothetical protein
MVTTSPFASTASHAERSACGMLGRSEADSKGCENAPATSRGRGSRDLAEETREGSPSRDYKMWVGLYYDYVRYQRRRGNRP